MIGMKTGITSEAVYKDNYTCILVVKSGKRMQLLMICFTYIPPQENEILEKFLDTLDIIKQKYKVIEMVVMGDLNVGSELNHC